jgi:hypothetical protein
LNLLRLRDEVFQRRHRIVGGAPCPLGAALFLRDDADIVRLGSLRFQKRLFRRDATL